MTERQPWPIAHYLQDGRYGLRAPVREDAQYASAWFEGTFPVSADAARALLESQETIPWGANPTTRLIIVELKTDSVVGGALVEREAQRVGKLRVMAGGSPGEETDAIRTAALRMLLPWAMNELDLMTIVIDLPSDDTAMVEAAHDLGMVEAVRLREHILRPSGRVDLLMLEIVNRNWGRGDA